MVIFAMLDSVLEIGNGRIWKLKGIIRGYGKCDLVGLALIGSVMPCPPPERLCGGSFGNEGTLINMYSFEKVDVRDGVESLWVLWGKARR